MDCVRTGRGTGSHLGWPVGRGERTVEHPDLYPQERDDQGDGVPCTGKNTPDTWDHRTVTTGLRNQVSGLTDQINRACVDLAVVGANGSTVFPNWPDAIAAHTTHTAGFLYRHPECTGHLTLH